jgi:allophanate hydrolase subunit 1
MPRTTVSIMKTLRPQHKRLFVCPYGLGFGDKQANMVVSCTDAGWKKILIGYCTALVFDGRSLGWCQQRLSQNLYVVYSQQSKQLYYRTSDARYTHVNTVIEV